MLKKCLAIAVLTALTAAATASEIEAREAASQIVELQDGSTLYVFPNGKMAVENRYGRSAYTRPGTALTAADGTRIMMVGNEVSYLDGLLRKGQGGE